LSFQLSDLLEEEEEWSESARVLMGISMDSGQRYALHSIYTLIYVTNVFASF